MNRIDKIKQIRKLAGVQKYLSWPKLCSLTNFDSFTTCFAFGFDWKKNCPDDRLATMSDAYINMILFNLTNYPKDRS